MSCLDPGLAVAGILAVTITAATLAGLILLASTETPMRSSMLRMELTVKGELLRLSPVPFRPTTRP